MRPAVQGHLLVLTSLHEREQYRSPFTFASRGRTLWQPAQRLNDLTQQPCSKGWPVSARCRSAKPPPANGSSALRSRRLRLAKKLAATGGISRGSNAMGPSVSLT